MKAKRLQYKTTIVGIKEVGLSGKVAYDPDLECYTVGGDSVEYWLERIEEKQGDAHITLDIRVHDGNEDDELIVKQFKPLVPPASSGQGK